MSLYQTNILDFIYILETKPELFSAEDRADLENLVATVPDDVQKLSNEILAWYKKRQPIDDAIKKLTPEEAPWRAPKGRKPKIKASEFKKTIQNSVRQSKPPSDSPKK